MALEIITDVVEETTAYVIAKQRLWLTADRERLVVEGDPEAAFLFAPVGHQIRRADAERLGLIAGDGAPEAGQAAAPAGGDPWAAALAEKFGPDGAPAEPAPEQDKPKPRRRRKG